MAAHLAKKAREVFEQASAFPAQKFPDRGSWDVHKTLNSSLLMYAIVLA